MQSSSFSCSSRRCKKASRSVPRVCLSAFSSALVCLCCILRRCSLVSCSRTSSRSKRILDWFVRMYIKKKKCIGCGFCRSIQKCIFRAYVEHSSADLNHSFFFLSYQAASTQTFTRSPINKVGRRGTHPQTDSHLKCAISFCRCKHEATIQKISIKSSNHWEWIESPLTIILERSIIVFFECNILEAIKAPSGLKRTADENGIIFVIILLKMWVTTMLHLYGNNNSFWKGLISVNVSLDVQKKMFHPFSLL